MADTFSRHSVEWTPDRIERFWDFNSVALADTYFAAQVGHSVVRYVSRRIRIGTALDLGCGNGSLMLHLANAGHDVTGVDQSPASIKAAALKLWGNPFFRGVSVSATGLDPVDTVFMVEVIEHMDDGALDSAIDAARKLLKPGGHVVLTTPNNENLDAARRMCPDCGCVFHQMQHVRSWTAGSLSDYMASRGFNAVVCEPTLFSTRLGILAMVDRLRFRGREPHLVYIGHV
jgi:2-polyprenyl-3-methyl-5-hydroxy-6-metoxy-1,4-benzoquinol methylase